MKDRRHRLGVGEKEGGEERNQHREVTGRRLLFVHSGKPREGDDKYYTVRFPVHTLTFTTHTLNKVRMRLTSYTVCYSCEESRVLMSPIKNRS